VGDDDEQERVEEAHDLASGTRASTAVGGDRSAERVDRHGETGLRPLQRNVRVGDVFALSKVVQLGATPVVSDLRERAIEMKDLSLAIRD